MSGDVLDCGSHREGAAEARDPANLPTMHRTVLHSKELLQTVHSVEV